MQIPPNIFVLAVVVFIGWCLAEAGWLNSQEHKDKVETKPELSQRGVPLSTCPDCYTVNSRYRSTLRYRGSYLYDQHNDFVYIESLHDVIIVIATVVIATSWVTIFSLILHSRIHGNMNQRFNAIVMAHFDPHQTFIDSRRQG